MWRPPSAEKCPYPELILTSEWLSTWIWLFLILFHPAGLFIMLNTNTAGQESVLPASANAINFLEAEIRSQDILSNSSGHYTKLVSCTFSSLHVNLEHFAAQWPGFRGKEYSISPATTLCHPETSPKYFKCSLCSQWNLHGCGVTGCMRVRVRLTPVHQISYSSSAC